MEALRTRGRDPRRQHPLPRRGRRRATTPSGASTSALSARHRCSGSCASCSAQSSTAATAARSRSAPAPATSASTCSRPASSREATCTDISPGMVRTLAPTPSAWARRPHRPRRRRVAAVRRRELRPRARSRGAAPPARPAPRVSRVSPRAAARRPDRVRRRAVARRRPAGLDPQARRRRARARLAPACSAPPRPPRPDNGDGDDHDHALEPFVDIHAFVPADLAGPRRAGFSDISVRGEELVANWFGWFNRSLEASAEPDDVPMLWRSTRSTATWCSSASTPTCSRSGCRRRSSTTCC